VYQTMDQSSTENLFGKEIQRFVSYINSLRSTDPLLMNVLSKQIKDLDEKIKGLMDEHALEKREKRVSDNTQQTIYILKADAKTQEVRELIRQHKHLRITATFLPKSFIVTLVSQYDAFLGRLIRLLFHYQPNLLLSSEASLTYPQLVRFDSINEARDYIVEKISENVLRSSHTGQIDWLEKKLKISLRKGLDIWPKFVELTERRNLFVHTDGRMSSQYLGVCAEHGVQLPDDLQKDDFLNVSSEYFLEACDIIFEMGVKLAHVLWRKIVPDEREIADANLNVICYELLRAEQHELALTLLEFATDTIKKHSSEEIYLYMFVNRAQALKWLGADDECRELISSVDWSAKRLVFKLAYAVLSEDIDQAAVYMKKLGPTNDDIDQNDYHEWPLFRRFRESPQFLEAYKSLFEEDYQELVTEDDAS